MTHEQEIAEALDLVEQEMLARLRDDELRRAIPAHTLVRMAEILRRQVGPKQDGGADAKETVLDLSGLPKERADAIRKLIGTSSPDASLES